MKDTFNPYVGLRPFQADESLLFFGRDDQTLELMQRLHEHQFVAVVGSSGCGKSSLLRAGLIPALKGGYLVEDSNKWLIAVMKPGKSPLFNLAKGVLEQTGADSNEGSIKKLVEKINEQGASVILELVESELEKNDANFFLLVDQFEELFRFSMDQNDMSKKDKAIDFVHIILELSSQRIIPFYVVLTMRSDFIGECTQFRGLPEAMNKSQYLVPRLTRRQLKLVIEGPAKLYGGKFNTSLTSKLLNKLGQVQDELPVLQHALMRMWDYEVNVDKSGEIDLEDYKRIGGLEKALSNHADEAMDDTKMTTDQTKIAETLFKALTDIDDSGRKIRRPVFMKDLIELTGANERQILEVIDRFIEDKRSFLIVDSIGDSGDKIIDISHESLIRQWRTLNDWVDEEGETASQYKQLAEAKGLYDLKKKDPLTGSELQLALEWRDNFNPTAVWANRYKEGFKENMAYLKISEAISKKSKRRRVLKNRAFVIFLLLIIVVGSLFSWRNNEAKKASALHFQAQNYLNSDPTLALRSEINAVNTFYNEGYYVAAQKIYDTYSLYEFSQHRQIDNPEAYSPDKVIRFTKTAKDSVYALINDAEGTIEELNLAYLTYAKFSRDGSKLLICCDRDLKSFTWDLKNKGKVEFPQMDNKNNVVFAMEHDRVIIGNDTGQIFIQKNDGTHIKTIIVPEWFKLKSLVMDQAGKKLFASSKNRHLLYDENGNELVNIEKGDFMKFDDMGEISSAVFSDDGKKILTGYNKKTILWNMEGEKLSEFIGHTDIVHYVAFSPDKTNIITASRDRTAVLWDTLGNQIERFVGHSTPIFSIDYTEDGKYIKTYSEDGETKLWRLKNYRIEEPVFLERDSTVTSTAYSPMENKFITGTKNGSVILSNTEGEIIKEFNGLSDSVVSVAFSPKGDMVVAVAENGSTVLWDLDGAEIEKFKWTRVSKIRAIDVSANGDAIVIGNMDGSIHLWNSKDGENQKIASHGKFINTVAFSPDGNSILSGSDDKVAILWSLKGDTLQEFKEHTKMISSVGFRNDDIVFTGSEDNTVIEWTLSGVSVKELKGHTSMVTSVAVGPYGYAAGAFDGTVIIWDRKGEIKQEINRQENNGIDDIIKTIHFSGDGTQIITKSFDNTTGIWEVRTKISMEEFLENNKSRENWEQK